MIKGAIFDVDGTLLDSMAIWEDAGARYLKKMGIQAEAGLSQILFPMSIEEAARYMKEQYKLGDSIDKIITGVLDTVRDFYFYEASLKPGAADLLKMLEQRGVPMAVATSSEWEHIEVAFQRLHIDHYFRRIFTCSEVGAGKSQPMIYQRASAYLGTKPEETYVFEDVLHAIETASAAGYKTVGVYDRFSELDQEKIRETADIYMHDLRDCAEISNKI